MPSAKIVSLGDDFPKKSYQPYGIQISRGRLRAVSAKALSANEIGQRYATLASLTCAFKQAMGDCVPSTYDRKRLVRAAGLAAEWDDHNLTHRIMLATSAELGKGGIIGSISNAVSGAVKTVTAPLKPVFSSLQKVDAKLAPVFDKIPIVGPALGAGARLIANVPVQGAQAAGQLTTNPLGAVASFAGNLIGDAASVAGGAVEGITDLPGQIASGIKSIGSGIASAFEGGPGSGILSSIYSGISGFISDGASIVQKFGSSVWQGIENADPSLSGEFTSLMHSAGADFSTFGSAIANWSRALKNSDAGQYTGKLGSELFTVIKDAAGHFKMSKTPVANASSSVSLQIPNGGLVPSDPSVFSAKRDPIGSPTFPGFTMPGAFTGRGVPTNPAGISLPGGPLNGLTSVPSDPTSMKLLNGLLNTAITKPQPQPQLASTGLLVVAGLGILVTILLSGRGSGPLVLTQPGRR